MLQPYANTSPFRRKDLQKCSASFRIVTQDLDDPAFCCESSWRAAKGWSSSGVFQSNERRSCSHTHQDPTSASVVLGAIESLLKKEQLPGHPSWKELCLIAFCWVTTILMQTRNIKNSLPCSQETLYELVCPYGIGDRSA